MGQGFARVLFFLGVSNPVMYVDPSGEFILPVVAAVVTAAAAASAAANAAKKPSSSKSSSSKSSSATPVAQVASTDSSAVGMAIPMRVAERVGPRAGQTFIDLLLALLAVDSLTGSSGTTRNSDVTLTPGGLSPIMGQADVAVCTTDELAAMDFMETYPVNMLSKKWTLCKVT